MTGRITFIVIACCLAGIVFCLFQIGHIDGFPRESVSCGASGYFSKC